jgi:hypothetical protein
MLRNSPQQAGSYITGKFPWNVATGLLKRTPWQLLPAWQGGLPGSGKEESQLHSWKGRIFGRQLPARQAGILSRQLPVWQVAPHSSKKHML